MVYEQNDRWVVDFVWEGRRIRRGAKDAKGKPAKSRTAAEQHENRLRTALATGTLGAPERPDVPTLASFKERYFRDHVSRLKTSTQDYQERMWKPLLGELADTPLDKIDAEALATLTRKLQEPREPHGRGLSAKTINNTLSVLRTALSHAEEWGLIANVPRVRWLKVAQSKFSFFDFDETAKLLAQAPPLVVVAVRTGMRIGELLALKWSDVSLERKQITVSRSVWWKAGKAYEAGTKSGKVRTIPLTADALAALESVSGRTGYVFSNEDGGQLAASQVRRLLERVQTAAGLTRTGWHALRHTFCSHLAMRSVPLPAIQALAGHSTITITMRYAHLAPDHLRQAIAALG